MKTRRGRIGLTLVSFLLGLLLVVQLRAQTAGAGGLQGSTTQELTVVIANLNLTNGQLRGQVATQQARLAELRESSSRGESSRSGLGADLARLRIWAGLAPASGRGAIVTFDGPVPADAVNDALNELLNAGAEALSIEDVRVVPGTVVAGEGDALMVEGVPLVTPFDVRAIGNPANLTAVLRRPGGLIGRIQVAQPEVRVEVREIDQDMELPATRRNLAPATGRPTE